MFTIIYRLIRLFGVDFPEILLLREDENLVLPEVDSLDVTIQLPDINFIGLISSSINGSFPASIGRDIFTKRKNIIWAIQNDLIPQGKLHDDLKHEYIHGIVSIFGIKLDDWLIGVLDLSFSIIKKLHNLDSLPIFPLYKGVESNGTAEFIKSGCKTLESKDGMLGRGVYLGTFWKACRYVGWLSTDGERSTPPRQGGVVFRYYVWGRRIIKPPWSQCKCSIHGCIKTKLGSYDHVARKYVDHLATWRENYDCAVVEPVLLQGFDQKTGRIKRAYIVRNEEWITKPENYFCVSAAMVDWRTIQYPYNPRQRDVKIF